ncbi:SusD/RagB family nutrient-binding outer membrane lipoprotein [Mariniflexile jejuense]|uniref:SusD/RagB family nutrient-binding outer membrane lipoprotein n=1 Tax=Mariniflexile jejuense TaxID=1173582 RepID=A0ABW3JHK5_9FLAO
MKNITKNIASLLLTSLLVFTSCNTDLDINKDPDLLSPDQVPMSAELPAAITGIGGATGSYLAIAGGFWSQYWTQSAVANQYKVIDDYSLNSSNSLITGFWFAMYDALTDVKNIKANALSEKNWNYYLIATTLEVHTSQILVDIFGSIPYSEANNTAILNPKFEQPDVVYDKMVADLTEALGKNFLESPIENSPGSTDLIFGGDMDKWKQFANTLLLKLYMRQSQVRPTIAQNGINALLSSGVEFLSTDAAITQFANEDSKSNPLYESDRRQLNVGTNLRASQTLGGFLSANSDARLAKYYNGTTFQVQGNFDEGSSNASVVILTATDPLYFISKSESLFLQAEADVRYGSGTKAKSLYDEAVNASFSRWNLTSGSLLTGNYAYPNGTSSQNLKAILTQKWISCFPGNGYEAFFEHNRTGIPKKSAISQTSASYVQGEFAYSVEGKTGGKFPRRFEYPSTELQRNSNAPSSIISITEPVWFDLN